MTSLMRKRSIRSKRRLILNIDLPALLAFAFFAGLIFFYLIPGFKNVMMDRKRDLIHEMTASAYSLLTYYHSLESDSILLPEEAQRQALEAISRIRYGDRLKDYFWITDMHPHMLMHPYRSDLIDEDLTTFRDSKGKAIFVDFVKEVSSSGESYVDYMWQWNDDSTRVVPKLSYVRLFQPWGWVVGTGIYVDDVRLEIRKIIINALIISGFIGVLIILLLTLITRQSHKIEEKRKEAEAELRKSRELYRTLAEATTEGVMIWSGQGLQANKTLLTLLGYAQEELHGLRLHDILQTTEIKDHQTADALYEELSTRLRVKGALRTKEGNPFTAHADLSRIDMNGMQAVLAVIRPTKNVTSAPDFVPHGSLLSDINTGFFRISYGRRNRFLNATEPILDMLGYQNIQELLPLTIDTFFANPIQLKTFRAVLAAGQDFMNQEVLIKQRDGNLLWVVVSVMVVKTDSHDIWCEGSMEPLSAAAFPPESMEPDLSKYGAAFVMQAPLSAIYRTPVLCPEHLSVQRAMKLMQEHETQSVIVTQKDQQPLGVLDAATIGFHLAQGQAVDTPAFRWMHAPILQISSEASIHEAYALWHHSMAPCLLVVGPDQQLKGMLTHAELTQAFFSIPRYLISQIEKGQSAKALQNLYLQSQKIDKTMVMAGADAHAISLHISAVADVICRRVLALCVEETGHPPCRFAFIQTGSAGRREQSFSTDQDNGIIFEDVHAERLDEVQQYFLSLGRKVNLMLAEVGFKRCPGNNMAGNPKWSQTLSEWKNYFASWIKGPGPEELLEVSIFFDFRYAYGDESLVDELRRFIQTGLHTSDIFFHHMTAAWKPFNPSPGSFDEGKIDIKRLLMPLTGLIRMYSLKHGIQEHSTVERIMALYTGRHLDLTLLRESLRAWKNLSSLRLMHQAGCLNQGKIPDNIIDYRLDHVEAVYFIKHGSEAIQNLILKAGTDFHTNVM